jgi:hypothetical protein
MVGGMLGQAPVPDKFAAAMGLARLTATPPDMLLSLGAAMQPPYPPDVRILPAVLAWSRAAAWLAVIATGSGRRWRLK